MKNYDFLYEMLNEKVWNSMEFRTGLLRPYVKKYEMIGEINFVLWICMKQYETLWNKSKTYEYIYELKAEDFALWNFKLIIALTW